MKLKEVMNGLIYEKTYGDLDIDIKSLQYDSRKVGEGDMFFCVEGFEVDGHKYIKNAIEQGAALIICSKEPQEELLKHKVTFIKMPDIRKVMAICASNFYYNCHKKLKLIGITGTNGKTTSSFMLKSILETAGYKVSVIGTIANYIGNKRIDTHRTTPEALELHELFQEMVEKKVDYCIMEVSSHSLVLSRVYGLEFEEGIFTNLTQDHLDFHKTFENYYNAKLMLFKNSKRSIINIEDDYGNRLFNEINNKKVTYGTFASCDVRAEDVQMSSRGINFKLCYKQVQRSVALEMPGAFNLSNALCSAATCLEEGIDIEVVAEGLNSIAGVPGRCEVASKKYKLDYDIILDYAHSPDSLKQILKTVREFTIGKIICVFGCGGDRDTTKRAQMGFIGTELSDIAIITSDNPRSEDPKKIIEDIILGVKNNNYIIEENRKEAIKKAIALVSSQDTILIAGKGHEDYQELKTGRIHFDEREIIEEIFTTTNC
ncbi:MAG: UDP-N-acetylmuramoyl-L-alanyl-D-glutamate--2,6-diaminopimelate ligase [Clostridiaceae bacterium]|nr:UDP-N-acetylmuramoyl-L-alanyl-D-glutamate--2,6-diaminopimelate ligase [Clostridiaceae bacterium]